MCYSAARVVAIATAHTRDGHHFRMERCAVGLCALAVCNLLGREVTDIAKAVKTDTPVCFNVNPVQDHVSKKDR